MRTEKETVKLVLFKSDTIGAAASLLCLLHCLATPIIFMAQACTDSCCTDSPTWWNFIDFFFLLISFFAVYRSTQTTSKEYMKYALWISWLVLFVTILNEKAEVFPLPESLTYFAAIALVLLHLYNMKYCNCNDETKECCIHNE